MRSVLLLILCLQLSVPLLAQPMSLVIGIDGLGYGQRGLDQTDTPQIDSLIDGSWAEGYHGSYTDQAFAGGVRGDVTQQPTVSGPGWSTILTGVWSDRHGVTGNNFSGRDYEANPTFLEIVEEALPEVRSGSFVNWNPIDTFLIASVDDRNSEMDVRADLASDLATANTAASFLRDLPADVPASTFVALDDVDIAGHQCGSSGPCYQNAITLADIFVGRMLRRISARESFPQEDWQIVLTSDHGHRPSGGHGGHSTLERQIPFIVSNRRVSPGAIEPGENETPVSHADVVPTVLEHFGIPRFDHLWGDSRANGPSVIHLLGDFDADGILGIADIDALTRQVASGLNAVPFDLNVDGVVDPIDINIWIKGLAQSWIGDVNLDLEFNSNDLVLLFQTAKYETDTTATWSTGDWNGDARFNSADLVMAFEDGGFERGPRAKGLPIPEPGLVGALTMAAMCLVARYR